MGQETSNFDSFAESLYRRGSDRLLSDSSVRDALNDEQARQLLDWALAQLRARAEALSHLPAEEARSLIDDKVHALRRRMQQANQLIEQIPREFDRQVIFSHVMESIIGDEEE